MARSGLFVLKVPLNPNQPTIILMVFVAQYYCGYKAFFTERTHQTKVGPYLSDTAALISGVVQGSGIGPFMFPVYINELAVILDNHGIKIKLFADDVKLNVQIINEVRVVQLHLH